MMDNLHFVRAREHLLLAALSCHVAYWDKPESTEYHRARSVDSLKTAADQLGFDLVPRMTAQEAADLMLEKRRAEDEPDVALPFTTDDRRADERLANIGGGRV